MTYKNKTVIVTGAAHGIGRAIARMYAENGAHVVLADKDVEKGKEACAEIVQMNLKAIFVATDVSKPEDLLHLVHETVRIYGGVDILINNAGVSRWKSPYELAVDEWDDILNTNLRSMFLLSREVAKYMKNAGGSIVNIASTRAFMSEPDSEAYAASKGGIISLSHALAASFAKDHIQVNSISPGWINTDETVVLRDVDHSQHFAGRVGVPEDVARACLFLTQPENNFISGTNLTIDGGMTKKMIYVPDGEL